MTPRYRTAFSVPSGFSAVTPVAPKAVAAAAPKSRTTGLSARPQVQRARDTLVKDSKKSAAA